MKVSLTDESILKSAKKEFIEKGFTDASMRTIAERSGCTTGTLYSRFADKDKIFCALVEKGAETLYDYFLTVQNTFADYSPEQQKNDLYEYTKQKISHMITLMYDNFDAFKLIICKSAGSSYEHYVDRLICLEMKHTVRYINLLRSTGMVVPEIREDFNHMLASALFNGIFEVIAHDLSKKDAVLYINQLQIFFNAGWSKILGLPH